MGYVIHLDHHSLKPPYPHLSRTPPTKPRRAPNRFASPPRNQQAPIPRISIYAAKHQTPQARVHTTHPPSQMSMRNAPIPYHTGQTCHPPIVSVPPTPSTVLSQACHHPIPGMPPTHAATPNGIQRRQRHTRPPEALRDATSTDNPERGVCGASGDSD